MTDPWRTGLGAAMGGASTLGLDTLRGEGDWMLRLVLYIRSSRERLTYDPMEEKDDT